jgi:rhodanese-related sulfurtransferase
MKTTSVITIIFLVLSSLLRGQVPDSLKYISVGPFEFQKTYELYDKALYIDVREFFEYKKSRIKNAVNIPSSGDLESVADTLSKESSLFLYCTSDWRSIRVAKFFFEKGFTKLYSLNGGINAWKKEGYPVDNKRLKSRDKKQKKSK